MTLALLPANSAVRERLPDRSRFDEATIQAVADRIEQGLTYAQIAALPGMPSVRSIERMVSEQESLTGLRACARRVDAERYAMEGLAILDAPLDPSKPQMASAEVTRARNRADFRRWLAECWDRDTYGPRPAVAVQVNVAGVAFTKLGVSAQGDDE